MPKSVLKKVRKLEIKTKFLVDGLLQGAYHSIFKGRGIEFSEVREYVPGDDIRIIDWNVTSRMNKPFVKEFIEERDLTVYIVFDISGSYEFGNLKSKRASAIELAASIMFAAIKNNDRVGLCLFTDQIEKFIPAKKGKKHILNMIKQILYFKAKHKTTNLNTPLKKLSKILKKKSIIFLVSDFFADDFSKPLSILKRKHDLIAIKTNDLRELEIPDVGFIELEDEETGEQILVNTSDPEFRLEYKKNIQIKSNQLATLFKRLRVDTINLTTDQNFSIPLKKFFKMRSRRFAK